MAGNIFILQEFIHIHVRDVSMPWSSMFNVMESIRDEYKIVEDYSISETTLEQVFISFAKQQKSIEKSNAKKDEFPDDQNLQERSFARHLSRVSHASVGNS